eukprot:6779549-Prymnesium_polylepis.1
MASAQPLMFTAALARTSLTYTSLAALTRTVRAAHGPAEGGVRPALEPAQREFGLLLRPRFDEAEAGDVGKLSSTSSSPQHAAVERASGA